MKYKLYIVGGYVRDMLLGIKSKDVDYAVVFSDEYISSGVSPDDAFRAFDEQLQKEGFEVFLRTPDCFTIRAKFPENHQFSGVADFVLARKELYYVEGTRKPMVVLGTLEDDLSRRDFTVNALAIDEEGNIIDLFNGKHDLNYGILRTPKDAVQSFKDDPLRILRAMRFSVTKEFSFSDEIVQAIRLFHPDRMSVVSVERIREEMVKMFQKDTYLSLRLLQWLDGLNPLLYSKLFESGLKLEPTLKK